MAANYAGVIAYRLQQYGFNKVAIAGILGNLEVESGLNPASGAQDSNGLWSGGIASWNGGRYTAMQSYARSKGKQWTDVTTQVDFLVSEMSSQLRRDMNNAGSASNAARVFDFTFERSADINSWGAGLGPRRVMYAEQYYNSGIVGSGVNTLASMVAGVGGKPGSGSGIPGANRLGDPTPTGSDYTQALGSLAGLLTAIPELHNILQQAVVGGWAVSKFQQAVEQSHWYRSNNAATRELVSLAYSDPAEYRTRLANSSQQVQQLAHQMGVVLNPRALANMAHQFIAMGWTQQSLQQQIARYYNQKAQPTGDAAKIYQSLTQMYGDYGLPTNFADIQHRTQQILGLGQTMDGYKQGAINSAKSLYPGVAPEIDQGMTVRDIASPYVQTQANLLEIDPNSINFGADGGIKKALQGQPNAQGVRIATPIWQYEQQVRSDPRWQFTNNSRDMVSSALVKLGADFGFGPQG
jgi:hypothetical protein